ncbi:hypothetical protein BG015_007683 [Linnemannia schmuckeri]|uniref:Uncharacterized protein n=1 Tax=Linnemannia schmuckeri TaxID=64567 RepID=A0A9P5VEY3_9FUNG|nr:hypothetical protein BG015_007683 [Linnemannia schmuckeri]
MTKTIQNGRHKIWRSPEQHQLIVTMNGANSMAVLGRPDELEHPETGIWIVTTTAPSPDSASIASEGAVSATLQHEVSKAYLALDDPTDPGQGANIYVKSDDKQVWTINPASTTGDGGEDKNEFHIGYPDLVKGQVLVVDNSFARAFPPRLALQPLGSDVAQIGLPWRFEPVD